MLQSRLTTCSECDNISLLLDKINCKVAKIGNSLYGNAVFLLNNNISASNLIDLLTYKRILAFKQVNLDYCEEYTIDMIASKVRILTAGAVCAPCESFITITTTTTTTILSTSTTTTQATTISPD